MFDNVSVVENFLGLPGWLRRYEPALHAELYGGQDTHENATDDLQAAAQSWAARRRRARRSDPAWIAKRSTARDRGSGQGAERRGVLKGFNSIVNGIGEIRNEGFGTGPGVYGRPELDVATARLVVTAAAAAVTFYVEAYAATDETI